jgi:hypothetical protein
VNPRGAVGDGLYNEDSGAEDFSPDFEFDVATARFEGGWSVEFRIPFSVLRFGHPASREWSTMVFRNYPRDQRYRISTSKLPREQNCFICLNEPLTGLDDLPPTRHLELTPNATVRSVTRKGEGREERENDVVQSLDLKWRPRADVVVDAASLRALSMSDDATAILESLDQARRASRMARTEALPESEYLANIVLARMRRLAGFPYLAAHILTAVRRYASAPWHPWIAWELLLAGGLAGAGAAH